MPHLRNSIGWIVFAFGIVLPFNTKAGNIALIIFYLAIFLFVLLGYRRYESDNIKLFKSSTILLLIPALSSLAFTEDFSFTINVIGKRIAYLITPIFFLFLNEKDFRNLKNASSKGLTYGVLLSSLLLISINLYKYYQIKPLWTIDKDLFNYYHTNKNYTELLGIHPTYYGMYVLLGLITLRYNSFIKLKIAKLTAFAILTTSILFLNSRIIIILYLLTSLFFLFSHLQSRLKDKRKVLTLLFLTTMIGGISFITIFKKTYFYQRITDEIIWDLSYEVGTNYNTAGRGDSRLARWGIALKSIWKKPIIGYGVGQESKILARGYSENNLISSAKYQYNAHNQYLGFALEAGLIGLALLCFYFYTNIKLAVAKKDVLSIFFFAYVSLVCLFENYLIRNAGIIYIAFFSTLFLYNNHFSQETKNEVR